jgi:hypothetical protein
MEGVILHPRAVVLGNRWNLLGVFELMYSIDIWEWFFCGFERYSLTHRCMRGLSCESRHGLGNRILE